MGLKTVRGAVTGVGLTAEAAEVIGGDFFNAEDAGLVCQVVMCLGSLVLARNFAVHVEVQKFCP